MILVLYTFITWWWFLFLYFMYEFYVTSCRGTGTWMYTTLIIIWHECDMYTYIWVCIFQGYTACELISRILQGCEGSDFNLINLIWFYTCTNVMGVLIETQDPIFRCLMQFECIGSHIFFCHSRLFQMFFTDVNVHVQFIPVIFLASMVLFCLNRRSTTQCSLYIRVLLFSLYGYTPCYGCFDRNSDQSLYFIM